jgi:hypothetical protein
MPNNITIQKLSQILGTTSSSIDEHTINLLGAFDSSIELLTEVERDNHILSVMKRLEEDNLKRDTLQNQKIFENGWSENLKKCQTNGITRANLTPAYIKQFEVIRLLGNYVRPANRYLVDDLYTVSLDHLFREYLLKIDNVYEFGCGTGRNLLQLSELFPNKKLFGLDWAESSMELLKLFQKQVSTNILGHRFDMLHPDDFSILPNSAVVTVVAMEQLGDRYEAFLDYLEKQKPSIIIHVEPFLEMYGEDTLFDYLGALYHRKRGYLNGYLPTIRAKAQKGEVTILKDHRQSYGDPWNEGTGVLVWKFNR